MEFLIDVGRVEPRFDLFGDSVSVGASLELGLLKTYHRLSLRFGRTRWYSKVMRMKWRLILVHLEIVLVSVQDRCTVCATCTIGSEIILDASDGTPT